MLHTLSPKEIFKKRHCMWYCANITEQYQKINQGNAKMVQFVHAVYD
jgi:hypothetical protein